MSTHRLRPHSPTHHRDPHRASTGNVYVTSYDTISSGHSARSSVSNAASHASNVTYEAQPIRQTFHPEGKKTQYLVRPRHNSSTGLDAKRPPPISTTGSSSPSQRGPRASASPREIMSAVLPREDKNRLLLPSSALVPKGHNSRHQRHNSASRADLDSFNPYPHRKERLYHSRGNEPSKQYYVSRPQEARQAKDEDWSYTGPREQFARDFPLHPRRDSHSRRERLSNAYESDRDSPGRKDYGPLPVSSNQRHHTDRVAPGRYQTRSGFDSDPDRPKEAFRRHQSLKAPTVLHQHHSRDEGYSSSRDDYDSRAHSHKYDDEERRPSRSRRDSVRESDRDRRKERERDAEYDRRRDHDHQGKEHHRRQARSGEASPDRSHLKDVATGTLGGLATAGALTLARRDSRNGHEESEEEEKKHRHRRRRHHKKDEDTGEESDNHRQSNRREESSSESLEDRPHRRRHSRRRHHDEDDDGTERLSDSQRTLRPRSVSRVRPEDDGRGRGERDHAFSYGYGEDADHLDARTITPGEHEDGRPRKVMLVEPEKKEEVKPRGILKPARQVPFPEDPNPIREGVAPLKDAKKDGVPVNARWTKISRVLVNPEALKKANERFEERDDYVIVLRVVSREEIQKLADKTAQIREAREREWHKRLEERPRSRTNGHDAELTDSEEEDRQPLAIEAPPSASQADLRSLSQPQQSHHYPPQPASARPAPNGTSVPDIHVTENYSQNV